MPMTWLNVCLDTDFSVALPSSLLFVKTEPWTLVGFQPCLICCCTVCGLIIKSLGKYYYYSYES